MVSPLLQLIKARCAHSLLDFAPVEGLACSFVNPSAYRLLRNAPVSHLGCWGIDGILLVVLLRLFVGIRVPRTSFDMTSVARYVLAECEAKGLSVFFVGTTNEKLAQAVKNVGKQFPRLRIAGSAHGFATPEMLVECAIAAKPDVVVCGMGCLRQEAFLALLVERGFRGASYTCGGFLHQAADALEYYPRIINWLHLRAFWRFAKERHTRRRYLVEYPVAVMLLALDSLRLRMQPK